LVKVDAVVGVVGADNDWYLQSFDEGVGMDEAFILRKHGDWFGLIAIDLSDIEHCERTGEHAPAARVIGIFVIVIGAGCRLLPEDDGRAALALANLRDGGKPLTGVPKDKRFKQRRKEAPTEGPARGIRLDALRRGASVLTSRRYWPCNWR
jgi:hypothetical protein